MLIKKLAIDLWASATSHLLVAAWLPHQSNWVESVLVIVLTVLVLVLLARPGRSPGGDPKPWWKFKISHGPNGFKLSIVKSVEPTDAVKKL